MTEVKLNKLLEWGKVNGVELPNVEFQYTSDKGIVAVASSLLVDAKFSLPKSLIISNSLARKHFNKDVDLNSWLKLLLCKLKYHDEVVVVDGEELRSKFGFYLNCLPDEVNSPLQWNVSELELLNGTNLGSATEEKFYDIVDEWRRIHVELGMFEDEIRCNEEVRRAYLERSAQEAVPWYSFRAFLWAHLILTSRAFPEKLLDPTCDDSNVVLLPILDLLNHDYHSKIEWSGAGGNFQFKKLEPVEAGQEVLNNYGGKSNEELLLSYGFVIEDNLFDCVALKLRPPLPMVQQMLEAGLNLPRLDDYTTYAFEAAKPLNKKQLEDYNNGILFLVNKGNPQALKDLLHVFAFQEAKNNEDSMSLRCILQSMQTLQDLLKQRVERIAANTITYELPQVNPYRAKCAAIYRKNQINILKHSIKVIKDWERPLQLENKVNLVTFSTIAKYDSQFLNDDLATYFQSDIEFESYDDILMLWILIRSSEDISQAHKRLRWVLEDYINFIVSPTTLGPGEIDEKRQTTIDKKYALWFPSGSKAISKAHLYKAIDFLDHSSYFRTSKEETVIVKGGCRSFFPSS
ncbi:HER092Cp [Eremothecium sinecaudum]|uniref:HER092Cp n=1 Tax=Eremothecium sinecaudum TaxID=45286 RepID=A0A0X8HT57_9SACH|nr:HER092Cp [Eremothecium sinecaudum]AMD21371.1 HER092Cp [Eremothecium sinecaudum]